MNLHPKKVETIIFAILTLHNVLRKQSAEAYSPACLFDRECYEEGRIEDGSWRNNGDLVPLERNISRNASSDSKQIRNEFKNYFVNEGSVPWQRRMVGLE